MKKIYTDCLILGSGGAGCAAAIYVARSGINNILLTGLTKGGQLSETTDVENYPGFISIKGTDLMNNMLEHAKFYGTEVQEDTILNVDFSQRPFILLTSKTKYFAKTVIISTGAQAKWLGLDSETRYKGYGVSGCAVCDGPFYKNKVVSIIGGGNTAATEALYLSHLAKKVYIVYRGDELKCENVLMNRIIKQKNIDILYHSTPIEILGTEDALGKFVTGLKYQHSKTLEEKILSTDGIFIAIGHKPNTDLFKEQLNINQHGYIIVEAGTPKTSIEGIFAAGDVCNPDYKQTVIAAGDGCKAALEVEKFLNKI